MILMLSKDCEQYLFSSEVHGKERSEESKTSLTAKVTCEWRAAKLGIVIRVGGSQLNTSRSHALDSPLVCVIVFLYVPPHGLSNKRETARAVAVYVPPRLDRDNGFILLAFFRLKH